MNNFDNPNKRLKYNKYKISLFFYIINILYKKELKDKYFLSV